MKYLIASFITFGFTACQNNSTTPISSASTQSIQINSTIAPQNEKQPEKTSTDIIIKNKADYSQRFVLELQKQGHQQVELKDSLIILNKKDTAYFPNLPKQGKSMVLTGRKDNLAIALTIKRLNYTTLDYRLEMVEFNKASFNQAGQVDLSPNFFMGDETDESEKTGNSYLTTEFSEFKDKNCYTRIRLGYEEESGPFLLGKLIKNCNGKIIDITLDNFTTLIEK